MKYVFFILIFFAFTSKFLKAQRYHYILQEVNSTIDGKNEITGFHGKNIQLIFDLNRNTLSLPIIDKIYNIRNLHLIGENSEVKMYEGNASSGNENDFKFSQFIHKEDNWNIFTIESIREKNVSISYVCIFTDTIVEQKIKEATGTGFFISKEGKIATNSHVIQDAVKITVTVSNKVGTSVYNAKVILNDQKNDVAVIKITDKKFKDLTSLPYGIATKANIGEKVFTIGYPLNNLMGENYKVTDGIISSVSGIEDDERYYQISVPIQPGNSGGPLFNEDGNIIGITSATLNSKNLNINTQNVNYAVKSLYLVNIDKGNQLPPKSTLSNKKLEEQIQILKNYVCLIKVYYE
jgi:S1-C subfamily serine protease